MTARVAEEADIVLHPRLVVRQLLSRSVHRHVGSLLEEHSESGLLWVVRFEVPLQIVEGPRAIFTLSAPGRTPVPLPRPELDPGLLAALARPTEFVFTAARARRCLVAISAGVAVATSSGAMAASATADTAPTSTTTSSATTASTAPTTPATPSTTSTTATTTTPATTTTTTAAASAPTASSTSSSTETPASKPASPADQSFTANGRTHGDSPIPNGPNKPRHSSTSTKSAARGHNHSHHTASLGIALTITRTHTTKTKTSLACRKLIAALKRERDKRPAWLKSAKACLPAKHHKHSKKHHGHRGGLGALAPVVTHHTHHHHHHPLLHHVSGGAHLPDAHAIKPHVVTPAGAQVGPRTVWNSGFNIDPFTAQQIQQFSTVTATLDQPPGFLVPIYKSAGRRYHIPWQILAAINAIETDYGRNLSISPAGAEGWMQFMPGTWAQYGLAANGNPLPNPYDPRDAIFSAARYLDANGGAQHLRRALFGYNHAWWYVDAVLWRAQLITDTALGKRARENGYALPLDLRYMNDLGRIDDGVDIEDAPDGVAVYSMTPGIVTAVASDPSGFGPDYPVILATKGPLAGQYIYYGHVAASLVQVGQHVLAGQPIAVMGHTGNAASLGHGHIEIGFSDASGDPLNHGGLAAWTPSGDAMRRVLIALSHVYRERARELADRRPAPISRRSPYPLQYTFTVAWRLLRKTLL